MAHESKSATQENPKDDLVERIEAKIWSAEAQEYQETHSEAGCRHFDDIGRAEDGHSRHFNSNFIIQVQVECQPKEDVVGHVVGWIAEAELAGCA